MSKITAFCLSLVLLQGCTHFPEYGKGGFAEHHIDLIDPFYTDEPMGPEHGLKFEFELLRQQLAVLILEGAEWCFPATVKEAQLLEKRVAREIFATLHFDATNDVIVLRHLLHRLERQLDYVLQKQTCQLPSDKLDSPRNSSVAMDINTEKNEQVKDITTSQAMQNILELINADNQFATDSAVVNLKYVARLVRAAEILKDYPSIKVRLTGHTDKYGSVIDNESLGLARAEQVGRYLEAFGVARERLTMESAGESQPLFDGDGKHIDLTNRRVMANVYEER